jgi:hypothetical protein
MIIQKIDPAREAFEDYSCRKTSRDMTGYFGGIEKGSAKYGYNL